MNCGKVSIQRTERDKVGTEYRTLPKIKRYTKIIWCQTFPTFNANAKFSCDTSRCYNVKAFPCTSVDEKSFEN